MLHTGKWSLLLGLLGVCSAIQASDAVRAVRLDKEAPTLHCLGFHWFVSGDANANASVAVSFRKAGAKAWRRALPLRRVESAALEKRRPPQGQTLFAGSILFLEPETEYEVKLVLKDPDGGGAAEQFKQRTWREPAAPAPKRTLHVVPGKGGGVGTKADPFQGLGAANNAAQPGDLILVHPGTYPGPLKLKQSGTAKAPIVWRGTGKGEAVIAAPTKGFGLVASSRQHIFIENLTFRGGRWCMRVIGAKHLTIRRCRLLRVGVGIFGDGRGQSRIAILDNVIQGVLPWPHKKGQKTTYTGELRGVDLAGTGHVIAYNTVSHFRDGIDVRPPEPVAGTDIHNNDIFDCYDDGIELDSSEQNVRAYRNRITNTGMGISFQPIRGGPAYAVRNILYNIGHETFKLHLTPTNHKAKNWREGPHRTSGGVILHNTVVKSGPPLRVWSNEGPANYYDIRNNLFVGIGGTSPIDITIPLHFANLDYNGYFHAEKIGRFAYLDRGKYQTIKDFAKKTGHEKHGFSMIAPKQGLFAGGWRIPDKKKPSKPRDFELVKNSPAIDKGQVLPSINDGFAGQAPDLGAIEFGSPPPHYGVRPPAGKP